MSFLALMLTVFSLVQGDALLLEYPNEDGLDHVEVQWRNRTIPLIRSGNEWVAIIGADVDLVAGEYPASVTFQFSDGRRELHKDSVRVEPKSFPITRLTVEPRFVELSPEDLERSTRESRRLGQVFGQITPDILWDDGFVVPIPTLRAVILVTGVSSMTSRGIPIPAPTFPRLRVHRFARRVGGESLRQVTISSMEIQWSSITV